MELFLRLNRERGMTILMVTHEPHVAAYSQRIVTFLDGRIVSDEPVRAPAMAAIMNLSVELSRSRSARSCAIASARCLRSSASSSASRRSS